MQDRQNILQRFTAILVYSRPPLVFGGMVCAIGVMWNRDITWYLTGVVLLLIAMSFDVVDGWFASRYRPNAPLTNLADRVMDNIVNSTLFPLVAVGMMWRLIFAAADHTRPEMLHAIMVLLMCITVLVRNSFAHFMRSCASQQGVEPETREFIRLRTMFAAPVGALLYIHAFYLPGQQDFLIYNVISWLANLPLRTFFIIEIVFLVIYFGSIAVLCKRYGTLFLDEVCQEDDMLRRRILALFPNALTLLNALMGIMAVLFTMQGWLRQAYLFLVGAAIFDKLDGALARKLGLTEIPKDQKAPRVTIGALLDDLADATSFCLAPALIFYLILSENPVFGISKTWLAAVAVFYFIMGVLRLIYFTFDKSPIPGFFKGMPTPSAALLVVPPLLIFSQIDNASPEYLQFWGVASVAVMIGTSLIMNLYPLHYLHMGRFLDKNPWFGRINMIIFLGSLFTPYFGYVALTYMVLYLFSPLTTRQMEPKPIVKPENPDA